jgi:maleylacetate reductase
VREFVHEALPMRVTFGPGRAAAVAAEVEHLGLSRVLVLCTPGQEAVARRVADGLGARCAGVFPGAVMHVPAEVADDACRRAAELGADGCVAVGGGSTVGLGKAIALRHGLGVVAVPTTYAGSEMTPIWGLTEDGVKRTGRDPAVLPRSVVYDPELTTSLPVGLSVVSGLNAVAHAAEALYAPDATPVTDLMAIEGARSIVAALPRIAANPADLDARADALRGAWLCGAVLGATTMSLHHKLCHVLGGTFGLPHAETHAVVLPHVLAFNLPAAPRAAAGLHQAVGAADVPRALHELGQRLGAPRSLRQLGMPASGIDEAVRQVLAAPYANPREVTAEAVTSLLEAAHAGRPPAPDVTGSL